MAAIRYKGFGTLGKAFAHHIQHRCNHQLIGAQITVSINDIDRNPLLPERTVVLIHRLLILHALVARPLRIIHRPAALLVKDNGDLRISATADNAW